MAGKSFQCAVVTPERSVLETETTSVTLPAHDGEIGILVDRAPLLCKLGVGVLRVRTDEGEERLLIDGGFAEMVENRLTVLTQEAVRPEDVDRDEAKAALDAALGMTPSDEEAFAERQHALAKARVRLKVS